MADSVKKTLSLTFSPVTTEHWPDFEKLFGAKGACGGCWCMTWRLTSSQFNKQKGDGNKRAMRKIINSDDRPGVIAYHRGEPVGWCSVAPREVFVRLESSRVLAPPDELPVWSITCLFIKKEYRQSGVSVRLIGEAVKFAGKCGAKIVEAYPYDLKGKTLPAPFVWTGLVQSFKRAGFEEAIRRSESRPIMRFYIKKPSRK